MSQAIVTAALNVGRVHPAGWPFVGNMFLALTWKCAGLSALWAAAGVAMLTTQPGRARRTVAGASTAILVIIVALEAFQSYHAHMAISSAIVIGVLLLVVMVVPGSVFYERRWVFGSRVDRALWLYLIGELVVVAVLSRQSTGAWYNYALQGVVFAAVLAARALSRAFTVAPRARQLVPAALAAVAVPLFAFTDAKEIVAKRRFERESITGLLAQIGRKPTEIFFVDRPGDNRLYGRTDLVYDPWLYPVFETIGLAEPRSVWLATRPVDGSGPGRRRYHRPPIELTGYLAASSSWAIDPSTGWVLYSHGSGSSGLGTHCFAWRFRHFSFRLGKTRGESSKKWRRTAENGAFSSAQSAISQCTEPDCTRLQQARLPDLTFTACGRLARRLTRQIGSGAPFYGFRGTKVPSLARRVGDDCAILSRALGRPAHSTQCPRSRVGLLTIALILSRPRWRSLVLWHSAWTQQQVGTRGRGGERLRL